ncbi:MAG TPA: sigma-70 family RNA polymerase sigma factor [Actinomycetes bacterium]|nr:sigma-70 family RNA polymerase sigma factor [Actinomycetes bacterium]
MSRRIGASGRVLPPDLDLVARLRDGDETAFELILDAWSAGLLRLARSFVSTDDSAAEVVQETWLAVIQGVAGFAGRSSLKTWVYRILVNTAKRRGQRESRTIPWSSLQTGADEGPTVDPARFRGPGEPWEGHWREFPAPWPSPEPAALAAEIRAVVTAALGRLPVRQRTVITLRDVEGLTSDEVSELLEITAANQRVLLHRARAFVRGELEAYFATAPERRVPSSRGGSS